jgi:capsular exopolysaccharide synthesis family protein
VELRRQIAIARAWLPLLVAGTLLAAAAAFLFTSTQPQVYQVSANLLPEQLLPAANPDYNDVSVSRLVGLTTNYAFIAKSNEFLSNVGQELDPKVAGVDLAKRVDVSVNTDTAGLKVTARGGSPEAAAALANAVALAIQTKSAVVTNDDSLVAEMATVRARLLQATSEYERLLALPLPRKTADELKLANSLALVHELTTVYDSLNASLAKARSGLVVVDPADPLAALKIAPLTLYYTLLAAVAGLLIAAGIASLMEYLDDRIKDPDAVQGVTNLGTLGAISQMKGDKGRSEIYRLATLLYPRSAVAEAYRTLRTNIEFAAVDRPLQTLLITSSTPGEGKTITAANLAVVFAQAGRRVLLVDADLRKPGVHLAFDLPNTHGLTTLLRGDEMSLDAIAHTTDQANLRLLTSGPLPPNPAELLASQRMRTVLQRLTAGGDLVIFDSAPLQAVTDSAILSSFLDGTVFVIDAAKSRRQTVRQGREALTKAGANVLGAVLNRIPSEVPSSYHDYYGDSYGAPGETDRPAPGPARTTTG